MYIRLVLQLYLEYRLITYVQALIPDMTLAIDPTIRYL